MENVEEIDTKICQKKIKKRLKEHQKDLSRSKKNQHNFFLFSMKWKKSKGLW